jgi:hypothetical protein
MYNNDCNLYLTCNVGKINLPGKFNVVDLPLR